MDPVDEVARLLSIPHEKPVERARDVGSVHAIIPAAELRPRLIDVTGTVSNVAATFRTSGRWKTAR